MAASLKGRRSSPAVPSVGTFRNYKLTQQLRILIAEAGYHGLQATKGAATKLFYSLHGSKPNYTKIISEGKID
jgi:hypothetical protein